MLKREEAIEKLNEVIEELEEYIFNEISKPVLFDKLKKVLEFLES